MAVQRVVGHVEVEKIAGGAAPRGEVDDRADRRGSAIAVPGRRATASRQRDARHRRAAARRAQRPPAPPQRVVARRRTRGPAAERDAEHARPTSVATECRRTGSLASRKHPRAAEPDPDAAAATTGRRRRRQRPTANRPPRDGRPAERAGAHRHETKGKEKRGGGASAVARPPSPGDAAHASTPRPARKADPQASKTTRPRPIDRGRRGLGRGQLQCRAP